MKYNIYLLAILLMCSCKSKKQSMEITDGVKTNDNNTDRPEGDPSIMTLKEGACYGTCEVFEMTIEDNGKVIYEGKQFAKKFGTFTKQLDISEVGKLMKLYYDCDFDQLEDMYPSQIADLQTITIGLTRNNVEKKTSFREQKPECLGTLHKALRKIARSNEGWTMVESADVDADIPEDMKKEATVKQDELIIELQDDVKVALWFKAVKDKYTLYLKRKVSPNSNFWLYTYDTNQFSPEEIMAILKKDADVKNVDFNVTVENR